jgi:hypothetical protein
MPAIASKLIEELFRISERFRDGRFGVQQEVGGRAVRQETGKKRGLGRPSRRLSAPGFSRSPKRTMDCASNNGHYQNRCID